MKRPEYQQRFYRDWPETRDLVSFDVCVRQTDLRIRADRDLRGRALEIVHALRADLESWIAAHPDFVTSLAPLPLPAKCPDIVRDMLRAGREYDVGPMAAVAGAVAESVGESLLKHSSRVIVENGGDIFVRLDRPTTLGLYAGESSPFTRRLRLVIDSTEKSVGVCTSSGTVGHSLSFGRSDAVVVVASSAAMADAAATYIGNQIHGPDDVEKVIEQERRKERLDALVVAVANRIGAFGGVEFAT